MDIITRNRTDLKKYFQKGDKPTELQFSEFIEAGLNQADDGIVKPAGDPLSIQVNDKDGVQKLLNFYEDFQDNNPRWALNLNPKEGTENRPGFNIMDGGGNSRLFIQDGTGNVGLGTTIPGDSLEIKRDWIDNNTNDWGGGIRLKGTAPTISFWETDNGAHRWMWHLSGDVMHLYRRPAGGSWENKLNINKDGTLFVSGGITSPAGTIRDTGGGWIRTYGDTGWFSQTHGGGWHMTDPTWIRSYGSKDVLVNTKLRADGGLEVGANGGTFKAFSNGNVFLSGAITSPEGTLRDDNGGWIRTYGNSGWYSQTHGGGWYMEDSTWIRSYGSKDVLVNTKLRADGGLEVGANGGTFKAFSNGNVFLSGAITSPEGTLRDDGGGWVRTYGNSGWYSQTHGGGWYMNDGTWIRSFGGKDVYIDKKLRADQGFEVGGNFKVNSVGIITGKNTRPIKQQLVHRRVIFGYAGDQPLGYNRSGQTVRPIVYGPFGYAIPPVQAGATRKYRIYAIYTDNMTDNGSYSIVRFLPYGAANPGVAHVPFYLPLTWGGLGSQNRDAYSGFITDASAVPNHSWVWIYCSTPNATNKSGKLFHLELETWDFF